MGGAKKISHILGVSLLMVGCILALWPAIGIGGQGAGKDAYEVGTANTTPIAGNVGDTLRLEGAGMLPNAELVVLFGVRIDNVNYIAHVGDAVSDASGNWSLNVPIPATVQAYNIVTVAGMGDDVRGTTTIPWEQGMGALAGAQGVQIEGGVVDGTTYPVVPGNYHYAGVTEAADGGIYGTNSNWIEVTDPAVDNAGSSPGGSYYSSYVSGSETSNAVLPNTGFPAALCCLAGVSLLTLGYILRSRPGRTSS